MTDDCGQVGKAHRSHRRFLSRASDHCCGETFFCFLLVDALHLFYHYRQCFQPNHHSGSLQRHLKGRRITSSLLRLVGKPVAFLATECGQHENLQLLGYLLSIYFALLQTLIKIDEIADFRLRSLADSVHCEIIDRGFASFT